MTRPAIASLMALFAPLLIIGIYLSLSRWPERWFTAGSDNLALVVAVLAGLIGLWWFPLKVWHRVVASLLYVPVMGALLFLSALLFVCGMFGDCL